jgi:hypothetical protein
MPELRLQVYQKHFPAVMQVMVVLLVLAVLAVLAVLVPLQGRRYPALVLADLTLPPVVEVVMAAGLVVAYTNAHLVKLAGLGVVAAQVRVIMGYPAGVPPAAPEQKAALAVIPAAVMVGFLMETMRMV